MRRAQAALASALAPAALAATPSGGEAHRAMQRRTTVKMTGSVRRAALMIALAMGGVTATAAGEESEGLDGEWKGRWNGGAKIAMTVEDTRSGNPRVTYCFKRRCWEPENLQVQGNTVTFTAAPNLSYEMELRAGKIHAKLIKGGRTFRGRMRRVEEKAQAKRQTQEIEHGGK